ncbi:MAG: hypothetical protein HXX17_11885 [Geobacteraceae bacterium]|nr:hypothetical protein [Geobacteraceae bacterium]
MIRLLLIMLVLSSYEPVFALDAPDPAVTYNILIYANQDYELNMTFKTDGVPENLTGRTYKMQAKKSGAASPFLNFSSFVTNAATGQTRYRLTRATTRNNSDSAGTYDIMETGADGRVKYRVKGTVRIIGTNTK